jgi:hypothetical protein
MVGRKTESPTTVLSATKDSVLSHCMDTLYLLHHTHVTLLSSMGLGDENSTDLSLEPREGCQGRARHWCRISDRAAISL